MIVVELVFGLLFIILGIVVALLYRRSGLPQRFGGISFISLNFIAGLILVGSAISGL